MLKLIEKNKNCRIKGIVLKRITLFSKDQLFSSENLIMY